MSRTNDVLIACLVPCLVLLHLSLAPYTKVEESFNIQAIHDILTYGIPGSNTSSFLKEHYDHLTFTGPVPRTFIGPIVLSGVAGPFDWLVSGVNRQILVRACLGLLNSFAILSYRNAVFRVFGRETANWYVLLQASQFHVMFWCSRTLPNFLAFGLSTFALRSFLPRTSSVPNTEEARKAAINESRSITILAFLAVTLRSELAILLATHCALMIFTKRLSIVDVLESGLVGSVGGLIVSIPIDTFLWQSSSPLWAEMNSFLFNVLQGHSADWGVMPLAFYFTSALPKLLFNPLTMQMLIPLSLAVPPLRPTAVTLLVPNLVFVMVYSLQPHKEWRFIVYTIPPLTAVAARSAAWVWNRRLKEVVYQILSGAIIVSVAGSFLASFVMLFISSLNYPGAVALNSLHAMADGSQGVIKVHMDAASCMSGVSRFLQVPPPAAQAVAEVGAGADIETTQNNKTLWIYDKTDTDEDLLRPEFWIPFDYALAENPAKVIGPWEIVRTVKGFAGVQLLQKGMEAKGLSDYEELPAWPFGEGPWAPLWKRAGGLWGEFERFMREHVTKGKWVAPRMEPAIHVLRKTRGPGGSVA